MKTSIIKYFFCLLVVVLVSGGSMYGGEPAVIVTVDGLSFVNTLLFPGSGIEDNDQYLETALENMNLDLEDTSIEGFSWSRDANDTAETVEALRTFLKEKYGTALAANKRFIVVAHSWGTVLTYLALSSQSNQVSQNERVYVDLYITLGSPLGTDNAHSGSNYAEETLVINYTANWVNQYSFCATCLPLADEWVNYWAWGDVISGPLDGFVPFEENLSWSDRKIDSASTSTGYAGRNTGTTVIWHMYDSLQSGGVRDNQPLLDEIKAKIEDNTPVNDSPPFGSFDTPIEGTTANGSVPVTGWALDDIAVDTVEIYREPVTGEGSNLVYIGEATFVEGARPDIEQAYPGYPNNSKAGWGYMMLTNFLPYEGNGTFTLHAVATDGGGHAVTLGTTTFTCDNANAVKPFGAIDTPAPGETVSGNSYRVVGWVLTPPPNEIPTDGSTIQVFIDGINVGHPVYNVYRSDIAGLFPGYANSNGAAGYFYIDTTAYANGVHTISWTAVDNVGNADGIGSRYFTINNSGERSQKSMGSYHLALDKDIISRLPADYSVPIDVKRGYEYDVELEALYPDEKGFRYFSIKELERVEIHFVDYTSALEYFGFQVVGEELRPLPVGSTLDREKGIFYWQPGPGFYGDYEFVFLKTENDEVKKIKLKVNIRSSTTLEVEVYTNLRERSRIFQDFKLNLHTDIFLEESRFNLVSYATPRLNRILMDTSTTIAFFDSFNLGRPLAGIYGEGSVPLSPICANLAISKPEMKEDSIVIVENLNFGDLTLVPVIETVIKKDSSFYGDSIKTCLSDKVIAEDTLTRYFTVDNLQLEGRADFKIFTVGSEPVRVIRGNGISIEPEMVYPDNDGVINVRIVNMERLKIHLDEYLIQVTKARTDQSMSITHQGTEPFYSGYLVVNDELRSLPIGSTMDTGKGIFYWQPGPEFLGDFEFAFFKEEGDETKRIRVLVKISAR